MADPRDRTMDYGEGRADGVAQSAVAARAMARRIRTAAQGCAIANSNAATLELFADTLAEIEQRREPDGLSYRGG